MFRFQGLIWGLAFLMCLSILEVKMADSAQLKKQRYRAQNAENAIMRLPDCSSTHLLCCCDWCLLSLTLLLIFSSRLRIGRHNTCHWPQMKSRHRLDNMAAQRGFINIHHLRLLLYCVECSWRRWSDSSRAEQKRATCRPTHLYRPQPSIQLLRFRHTRLLQMDMDYAVEMLLSIRTFPDRFELIDHGMRSNRPIRVNLPLLMVAAHSHTARISDQRSLCSSIC